MRVDCSGALGMLYWEGEGEGEGEGGSDAVDSIPTVGGCIFSREDYTIEAMGVQDIGKW